MSALLVNLQNDMQQLLPVLAAFNGNLLPFNTNSTALNSSNAPMPGATTTRQTNGTLLSRDFSSRVSQDLSAHVGAPPANSTGNFGGTSLAGGTNAAGSPFSFSTLNGTNSLVLTSAEQDAARALIILQNDLERSLPVVAALNGGAVPGFQGGLGTNNFGTIRSFLGTNNLFVVPGSRPASAAAPLTPPAADQSGKDSDSKISTRQTLSQCNNVWRESFGQSHLNNLAGSTVPAEEVLAHPRDKHQSLKPSQSSCKGLAVPDTKVCICYEDRKIPCLIPPFHRSAYSFYIPAGGDNF